MQKWMKCRTDSAVSPVVGVLLMLVVTIIIAAVVSGFAGGLVSTTQKAPAANIGMELNTQANNGMGGFTKTFTFTHKSGDVLNTKDLSIITYFVATNGTIVKHEQTATSEKTGARVPWLNDVAKVGYAGSTNPRADWGNVTWSPGDVLTAQGDTQISSLLGFDITDSSYGFAPGKEIKVKILHNPSGKYIVDGKVVVQ
jgi:flagellin-like protein